MTKKFLNIFSKRPEKIIKDSPKIIADYREKNSLVIAKIIKGGAQVELRELKVGDYIAKNTVVERKTIPDFIQSMKTKHLINQLIELQQYESRLLIIEGFGGKDLFTESAIHPNAMRGFLLSIALRFKTPIFFTQNEQETADYLLLLANKKEKTASLYATKKALSNKEQMQFILESFPGIGPKTATKLLKTFRSLENVFKAAQKEREDVIGKKAKIFDILKETYSE